MATLRDVLTAPFKIRSESLLSESGGWSRVVSYPELGCEARGEHILDVMDELEVQRVRRLVDSVSRGLSILPLRPPLADHGVEELLARAGLAEWIGFLDDDLLSLSGDSVNQELGVQDK